MKAVFVETMGFTEWVSRYLPEDLYARVQQQLMITPHLGRPMPGCDGLRKLRTSDPQRGKGKRGGARIIYLYIPEVNRFYLIDIYDKDEQTDLSAEQKKVLCKLAEKLKSEAKASLKRSKREEM